MTLVVSERYSLIPNCAEVIDNLDDDWIESARKLVTKVSDLSIDKYVFVVINDTAKLFDSNYDEIGNVTRVKVYQGYITRVGPWNSGKHVEYVTMVRGGLDNHGFRIEGSIIDIIEIGEIFRKALPTTPNVIKSLIMAYYIDVEDLFKK